MFGWRKVCRRDVVVANVFFLGEPLSNVVDGGVQIIRTHVFTSKLNDATQRAGRQTLTDGLWRDKTRCVAGELIVVPDTHPTPP